MSRDEVLAFCLELPGAEETYPFGEEVAVIKVCGKMFALVPLVEEPGSVEDDVVRGMIADSYDLVVAGLPRSVREELMSN